MKTQIVIVSMFLLFHYALATEMSFFKNSNYDHGRKYKNNINSIVNRKQQHASSPIQCLETPNFDIMLLTEDSSNPTWRKYSQLFQSKDMNTVPHIEVNYGNYEHFPYPFIKLDRSDIEAILASLGDKKHIFVLQQRNCKPHSNFLDEFENEFLPKLLQNLLRPSTTTLAATNGATYNLDPVVDRILTMLDKDEQKMLDDLRKTYEKPTYTEVNPSIRRGNPGPKPVDRQNEISGNKNRKHLQQKFQLRDLLYKVPCNEGYVFLVESRKNPMDPNALNDLLLRTLKIATKMS